MDIITLTLLAYQRPKAVVSFVIGHTTCWDHALCCAVYLRYSEGDGQFPVRALHAVEPSARIPLRDCSTCKGLLVDEPDTEALSFMYPTTFHEFTGAA